jgi:hypothetical protein
LTAVDSNTGATRTQPLSAARLLGLNISCRIKLGHNYRPGHIAPKFSLRAGRKFWQEQQERRDGEVHIIFLEKESHHY